MKQYGLLSFCLFLFFAGQAQYKVRFVLKDKTSIRHDSIYVTGTFSNWDSTANRKYLMQQTGKNEKSIVLNLPKGIIRYKFHLGSWFSVEKLFNGNEVADRIVNISRDTTLKDSVAAWRDQLIIDKKYALQQQKDDTTRVNLLAGIAMNYAFMSEYYNADSALFYANEALQLQQNIIKSGEYKSWASESRTYLLVNLQEITAALFHSLGNYPKALEIRLGNLNLAEKEKNKFLILSCIKSITDDYGSMNDYENVLRYGKLMDSIRNTIHSGENPNMYKLLSSKYIIATAYFKLNQIDSALSYAQKASNETTLFPYIDTAINGVLLGNIYLKKNDEKTALHYFRLVLSRYYIFSISPQLAASAYEGMGKLFQLNGKIDSALYCVKRAMTLLQNNKSTIQSWGENSDTYIAELSPIIAQLYKSSGQPDSAYKYLLLSVNLKDSLYNSNKIRQFQTLSFNEAARKQQLEQQSKEAEQQYRTRLKIYGLISIITGFLVLALILYRNNQQKQKANALLHQQKRELETTLIELKNTQNQLIQSEKMASLGELTAGIAHEIQNPLNFVNNFSEVNLELIEEIKSQKSNLKSEEIADLLNDIAANEEKINHHGKRADAIVKGMLQHSRTNTGTKEPTDINALCDEYVRLSYHGLRAKDKSFNATFKTDFDESIGKIDIVPQDMGRVILNLINNAFYAVDERLKAERLTATEKNYQPTVTVGTKKINGKIEITVTDNGNGIPDAIKEKIFQPFFTTKPTGQGTGLGLSLSYDIVKAHGGALAVNTKKGEYTQFIISLPLEQS